METLLAGLVLWAAGSLLLAGLWIASATIVRARAGDGPPTVFVPAMRSACVDLTGPTQPRGRGTSLSLPPSGEQAPAAVRV